jgi:hypothetical protein
MDISDDEEEEDKKEKDDKKEVRARGILEDTGPTRRPRINPANSKGF